MISELSTVRARIDHPPFISYFDFWLVYLALHVYWAVKSSAKMRLSCLETFAGQMRIMFKIGRLGPGDLLQSLTLFLNEIISFWTSVQRISREAIYTKRMKQNES